jgi:Fe-S oxidoreductase
VSYGKNGLVALYARTAAADSGLELTVLDSRCCGIAGTYGFKRENYATSQAIGAPLFRQIEESGADIVVTDCETCKWQIEMSTSKRCEHPSPCWRRRWEHAGAFAPAKVTP